jgi:subfamily B ATP-binding cassette protein MsbA
MHRFELFKKIAFLAKLLAPWKKSVILVFILILVGAIMESVAISMIFPILQVVVRGELQGGLAQMFAPMLSLFPKDTLLPVLCLLYLAIILLNVGLAVTKIFFSRRLIWRLKFQWIRTIYMKYIESKYTFILNHKQGELLNNLLHETQGAAQCLLKIVDYCSKIVVFTAIFVTLCFINWRITLVLSSILCIMWMSTNNVLKNYVRKKGREIVRLRQQISADVAESIGAIHLIKVFGISRFFFKKISKLTTDQYSLEIRVSVLKSLLENMGQLVIAFAVVGSILYINYFTDIVLLHLLPTLGVLVLLAQKLVGSVSGLASMRVTILSQLPSVLLSQKLSEQFIPQEDISGGAEFRGLQDDIVFKNVTFSYERGKTVLSECNMVIPLGKITAIVGPSGIGKSTIVNLLAGVYKPNVGCILCNGRNLSEWKLQSWRQKIGYVSQDIQLFNMSIRENILLGDLSATEEDIINAAKLANSHNFIVDLPDGYDTVIGERGLKLSGGQRQRISIARAIIRNPDLLIFDEATSALDNKSETLIQKAIEEIRKEKTIIIIAHRHSTIETADIVYDVGKNKVTETSK